MSVITIIGSGMMGSALAFPARENGNDVRLVGTHLDREIIDCCKKENRHPKFVRDFPGGVGFYQIEDLQKALGGAELIICGVSSFGVDWFRDEIIPVLPGGVPIISVTKGLFDTEDGELITYVDIWKEKLRSLGKDNRFCAIGGPCTSYELVSHDQTSVAFCGDDMPTLEKIRGMMQTDYYHISLSTNVIGIESAVALKNSYALGVALTIGVNQKIYGEDSELHFNSQAAVFGQATREMNYLLSLQGVDDIDILSVGVGDLYVTVYGGRTRLIGILLGRGLSIEEAKAQLEGVTLESLVVAERVARAVRKKAERDMADITRLPLLLHTDEIITKGAAVDIPWDKFRFKK